MIRTTIEFRAKNFNRFNTHSADQERFPVYFESAMYSLKIVLSLTLIVLVQFPSTSNSRIVLGQDASNPDTKKTSAGRFVLFKSIKSSYFILAGNSLIVFMQEASEPLCIPPDNGVNIYGKIRKN